MNCGNKQKSGENSVQSYSKIRKRQKLKKSIAASDLTQTKKKPKPKRKK
jgi:hypothetical protein